MSDADARSAYGAAIPWRRDSLRTLNSRGFFTGNNLVRIRRRGLRYCAVVVIRSAAGPAVRDASGPRRFRRLRHWKPRHQPPPRQHHHLRRAAANFCPLPFAEGWIGSPKNSFVNKFVCSRRAARQPQRWLSLPTPGLDLLGAWAGGRIPTSAPTFFSSTGSRGYARTNEEPVGEPLGMVARRQNTSSGTGRKQAGALSRLAR
jgi:hypothetical protein